MKQSLSANVFRSMKNLRLLNCVKNFTSCEPTFLPDELRWFCWRAYPFSSLPVAHMSKLVGLEMEYGDIKYLWKVGEKIMLQNLKFINLGSCKYLKRFPDVSGAPNIESLILVNCLNLVEVDESVGSLKKLLHLDMYYCYQLKCLPSMLQLESLETLILNGCSSLERIPEFSPCMVNLSTLDISGSKIEEVPSSIKYLSNLSSLDLGYTRLKNIPNSIWELKSLNTLGLFCCKILQKLPDDFQSLEELQIDSIHIHALTNSCYLRKLHLYGDLGDNDFPKNLHGLSSLEELHIGFNNKLIQLPESISHISSLKHLLIEHCHRLRTLHGLPPEIQALTVKDCLSLWEKNDCISLEKIEDMSKEYEFLNKIQISSTSGRCLDKMWDQSFLKKWAAVDGGLIIQCPTTNIPSWFKEQRDGCKIALKLPPKWQTEIIGFAICCVSINMLTNPFIILRFENDKMLVSKSEAYSINKTIRNGNHMWIGYIPYSLFKQFHGGNANELEGEDWFHMTEGNLVFEIFGSARKVERCGDKHFYRVPVERCGAKVVYKEDVASIQQTIPSISSSYWSWKLTKEFTNSYMCREAS